MSLMFFLFYIPHGGTSPTNHLQSCKLIAPKSGKVSSNVSIIIKGNKIVAVKDGFFDSTGATIIDLKNKTVMPGLMDRHVHL